MADKTKTNKQEEKEVKTYKSFDDKIHAEAIVRKRDLTTKDLKEMKVVPCIIEKRVSKKTKSEFVTMDLFVDKRYPNGKVQPKKMLTTVEYDMIEHENQLKPSNRHVINVPVRFFKGVSKTDGNEYVRVEAFLSKNVYRSIFLDYNLLTMLGYKKIDLNPVPDSVSQEGTDVLWEDNPVAYE